MSATCKTKVLVVGISGVTCGGKTTLASNLHEILEDQCTVFSQDTYFHPVDDPRHISIPKLNHLNFDVLTSLDMEKMHGDITKYIQDRTMIPQTSIEQEKSLTGLNIKRKDVALKIQHMEDLIEIVVVEGFCIFNYKPLLPIFHLKYYFTLDKDECCRRRAKRVYDPPDCPGYFEECVWPEHVKQLDEVRADVSAVKYIDSKIKQDQVLSDVLYDIYIAMTNEFK